MNYVYILKSEKSGRYYIGSTNNLLQRIVEHNSGKTRSLKNTRLFKLVFVKEFDILKEARRMELKLKKLKSRKILDEIIKDQRINMGL